jgi:hypothetical protein
MEKVIEFKYLNCMKKSCPTNNPTAYSKVNRSKLTLCVATHSSKCPGVGGIGQPENIDSETFMRIPQFSSEDNFSISYS